MPGQHITHRQEELYMQHRQEGIKQEVAAAKAGFSVRTGRRIEQNDLRLEPAERHWRTRDDPLDAVWSQRARIIARVRANAHGSDLTGVFAGPLSRRI